MNISQPCMHINAILSIRAKSYFGTWKLSCVSEILNIHPQTLRQYEREGLIKPSRTNGKIRLYSQKDIDNIKYVLRLTRDYGINLAGVSYILEQNLPLPWTEQEIHIVLSYSDYMNHVVLIYAIKHV